MQGVGGAAAVCAALELLPEIAGGERRAVRIWAAAGVAGAALGPAIGGLLTQLISWQSIFVAQVPLALIPAVVVFRRGAPVVARRAGLPHIAANLALGLLSAGLAAVLFLLVLLLVEGWRMPPDRGGLRGHGDAGRGARRRAVRAARRRRAHARRGRNAARRGRRRGRSGLLPRSGLGAGRSRRSCSSAPGSRSRSAR